MLNNHSIRIFHHFIKRVQRSPIECLLCTSVNHSSTIAHYCHPRTLNVRLFSKSASCFNNKSEDKEIVTSGFFENVKEKDRSNFLDMIRIFDNRDIRKRGHVEFIYAAMKHMEEFGVHKDLEVYKSLIDVFPKGKFIPTNIFQAEFQHYPKQQQCAIDLLEKMEDNGVMPDVEMEDMLVNVFGKKGHAVRKYQRMMYWMPKFKNLSPWALPNPVPDDSLELARLALQRIGSVDLQMRIETYQAADLEESNDKTWIVSAQSPVQQELLEKLPVDKPIFVEGSFRVWLRGAAVNYFVLRADPTPEPEQLHASHLDDVTNLETPFDESALQHVIQRSVHEQTEGTILAMAATGTSSRDSLLSWVRFLQRTNPALSSIPVLFSLTSPFGHVVPIAEAQDHQDLTHP